MGLGKKKKKLRWRLALREYILGKEMSSCIAGCSHSDV